MYNACIRVFMRYFSRTARLINDDTFIKYERGCLQRLCNYINSYVFRWHNQALLVISWRYRFYGNCENIFSYHRYNVMWQADCSFPLPVTPELKTKQKLWKTLRIVIFKNNRKPLLYLLHWLFFPPIYIAIKI